MFTPLTLRLGGLLRPLLVLAAAAALVAGAGCGGKKVDKQAYVRDVNRSQQDFAAAAGRLNLANPKSAAGFGQSLTSLGGEIDKLVARLNGLTPPDEVKSDHGRLVSSLRTYGDALKRDRGAFGTGDTTKIRAAARRIQAASQTFSSTFDTTIKAINSKLKAK